jgi:uncharacterized protein YgiM (DUF1202 family)
MSLEIMEVGGKSYIHGPVPLLDANEPKWYVADSSQGELSIADSFMQGFDQGFDYSSFQSPDLSLIKPLGKESMHGHQCDVYGSNDKQAVAQALRSSATMGASADDFGTVDAAEVKFWVCDDGYFHRMWVSVDGTATNPPGQKFGMRVRVSFFDFNGSFTVVAPANAAKLEQPNTGGSVSQAIPSSAPGADSGPTATAFNGGNIRLAPNMQGQVLGQLHAHQAVALVAQTVDGGWYYVSAPEATGWVHASLLAIPAGAANQVFVDGEARLAEPASETLPATVVQGGNRRAGPTMQADVLGLVHAGDTIQLLAKTQNGAWYYARCRCGARGWVHASLLQIDPKVARKVPVA